jgi:colanic acid/amylovoran biosynthesis glycosyltransferase
LSAIDQPRVAIFCPTFLKPEMLHVYRQVAGLKRVAPIVLTFKRENTAQFPFEPIRFVQRSPLRWVRRIWNVQIQRIPQQAADVQVNVDSPTAKGWLKDVFASCALVLARSESLGSALVGLGCPADKLRIQRAGIPLDTFRYCSRQPPADGAWRLLQACRLVEKKGLELTLRAFSAFLKQYPKASLTIAGDGPLRASLGELAATLRLEGRIRFAGFVAQSDLVTLYRNSHLFLHPSEQTPDGNREGVPNSLLEAMATGLPCIATRHGGIPEAITHSESGILVSESDLAGVEHWLGRLATDDHLRDALGKRAAEVIKEKFDLTTQIETLEEIYLTLQRL